MAQISQQFISTAEAAKQLGVSRITVFNRIKRGEIKAQKIGRNFVINCADILPIVGGNLGMAEKQSIHLAVKRVLKEYGHTLELLGQE